MQQQVPAEGKTFTCFPNLPPELRMMIWEHALFPRVLCIDAEELAYDTGGDMPDDWRAKDIGLGPRALERVCKEARQVTLEASTDSVRCFNRHLEPRVATRFDPVRDVAYVTSSVALYSLAMGSYDCRVPVYELGDFHLTTPNIAISALCPESIYIWDCLLNISPEPVVSWLKSVNLMWVRTNVILHAPRDHAYDSGLFSRGENFALIEAKDYLTINRFLEFYETRSACRREDISAQPSILSNPNGYAEYAAYHGEDMKDMWVALSVDELNSTDKEKHKLSVRDIELVRPKPSWVTGRGDRTKFYGSGLVNEIYNRDNEWVQDVLREAPDFRLMISFQICPGCGKHN